MVPSASLGLHIQDREFQCCLRYWLAVPLHSNPFPCPECHGIADSFWDHQVGCGDNGDPHPATMPSGMWSSLLPSLPHWPHPRKPLVWSLVLSLAQQTSSSLTGDVVVLLPLTSTSSALSSSRPLWRLCTHLGMPSKLASTASWPQNSRPVVQQGQISSPLWPRPWAVLLRTPSTQFGPSAVPLPIGLAPLTLPSLRGIYLAGLLLPCGVAMPVCGCIAIQLCPCLWTG